jgi:hypothetical protein
MQKDDSHSSEVLMGSNGERSLLGTLVSWFFVALLAIAALKLAFWVFGAAFGIGAWLLFTVGPLLLVGWLVVKLVRYLGRPR